jgi:broad specificity phosphatase PhoE
MADAVASYFSGPVGDDVTYLVASPLERAQETAAPIAAALGLDITTDDRVIEAQSDFAGTVVDLSHLIRPTVWPMLRNPTKPSWGEDFSVIADRMGVAIADARNVARGHKAIIVSHQSPIWRARLRAEGRALWLPPKGRALSLASVTTLTYDGDKLTSIGYYEPAASLLPDNLR